MPKPLFLGYASSSTYGESDKAIMYDLHPSILMTRAEYKSAKALLTAIRACAVSSEERFAKQITKRTANRLDKARQLGGEVSALAEVVLEREIGLRRLMVVYVLRLDGYHAQFQVLHMSFWDRVRDKEPNWWLLEGRVLSKDGRLGEKGAGIGFDCALIQRRRLDGVWVPLIPVRLIEVEDETGT